MIMRHPLGLLEAAAVLSVLSWAVAGADAADMRRRKKLIATGWDMADTERLRSNLVRMEQRPFDGIVLRLEGRRDEKKRCLVRAAFVNEKWERTWFQHCVNNLRACNFQRFTDNFILIGANPGNVDWFDDAGWAEVIEHWRIAAWLAKQGRCKGLLFDPEPYTPPHAPFRYDAQPRSHQHTFGEYYEKARRRGRRVMEAVAAEYPDITLYSYFMNSVCKAATGRADPRCVLRTLGYGLLPAFIDGWLDAAPPGVTFVDGCEMAYLFRDEREYLAAAVAIKGACQELVSPENRATYRAQVQVSYGIYLDAYWNPKDSEWKRWYVPGEQEPRVDSLRRNVTSALLCADEYVWLYGEKFRWWPTPNRRVWEKTWPEALPGIERILGFARDPIAYSRTELARRTAEGTRQNLARNGDFSSSTATPGTAVRDHRREGRAPAGWHTWQAGDSEGTFTWDRVVGAAAMGSARAAGVTNGCFLQSHEAAPGRAYVVRAVRRLRGRGDAWIRVRWQTTEGRWTAEAQDVMIHTGGPRDHWAELYGVAEVPETARRLVVLLGAGGQQSPADAAWFDDVELHKLQ
jgi:hypothetical protein